jgi:hypothetical protein
MVGEACTCTVQSKHVRPLTVAEQLAQVIDRWKGPLPEQLPAIPMLAAMRWIELQEPRRKRGEDVRYVAIPNGEGQREIDPYVERLRGTLQAFLIADDALRDLVVEGVKEKIYWRGDSMEMFVSIYEETLRMREIGLDAYRAEARQKARGVIRKLTSHKPSVRIDTPTPSWNDDGVW